MNSVPEYYAYWAKTDRSGEGFHRLPYHLLDVAACMHMLLTSDPDADARLGRQLGTTTAIPLMTALAALHDVGKFAHTFQGLAPNIQKRLQNVPDQFLHYIARHDALGLFLLNNWLRARQLDEALGLDSNWRARNLVPALRPLVEAIAGHHGKPTDDYNDVLIESAFLPENLAAADAFLQDALPLFTNNLTEWTTTDLNEIERRLKLASWDIAGWMVLADWLGSNSDFFPFHEEIIPLPEYWAYALERARDAIHAAGLITPKARPFESIKQLFGYDVPSPMQHWASTVPLADGPQIFILEDATGSGKTEAALILASRLMSSGHASGIYIGLPTTATANGMFARMEKAYDRFFEGETPSIVLAHSSRRLSDRFQRAVSLASARDTPFTYDGEDDVQAEAICSAWLADTAKKALLAPFGVGTIDQALLSILPAKHQSLRMVGLSGKVLIVDEAHAYDTYTGDLLQSLISFHAARGGTTIVLSATLSLDGRDGLLRAFANGAGAPPQRVARSEFPLATSASLEATSEHPIRPSSQTTEPTGHSVAVRLVNNLEECKRHLLESARQGRCACWIRNTVGEAVAAWEELRERAPDPEKVLLFHARFTLDDRQRIEDLVLDRFGKGSTDADRSGYIVVATQVVEQSLDLDFDAMVTDLAPIDLVIQRAGRLHRHSRQTSRPEPVLYVAGPDPEVDVDEDWYSDFFDGSQWVYRNHAIVWLSAVALQKHCKIDIPKDARELVESVYGDLAPEHPPTLQTSADEAIGKEFADQSVARFNCLKLANGYMRNSSKFWYDDSHTPTRLGDPTVRLRLAIVEDGELRPLAAEGRHQWARSDVSVAARKFSGPVVSEATKTTISKTAERMPDKGKFVEIVPLLPTGDGSWTCAIEDGRGRLQTLHYSNLRGLEISKEAE